MVRDAKTGELVLTPAGKRLLNNPTFYTDVTECAEKLCGGLDEPSDLQKLLWQLEDGDARTWDSIVAWFTRFPQTSEFDPAALRQDSDERAAFTYIVEGLLHRASQRQPGEKDDDEE